MMHQAIDEGGVRIHVAWVPAKLAMIGKHVTIDEMPGRWKIVGAGDPRPAYIVEAYADNAHNGFASVTGHEKHKEKESE